MKVIQRYLVMQFAKTLVMTFICLFVVMAVADYVGHFSEFMDRPGEAASLTGLLVMYYGARVPWFFDTSGRMIALLASVFVLATLQRHNEMTALQAAGISRWQIVRPLIWAGGVVAIIAAVNREVAIPRVRELLCQRASDLTGAKARPMEMQYDPETDILFDGQSAHTKTQTIEGIRLRLPHAWADVGKSIRASHAMFVRADEKHSSGYLLTGLQPPDALLGQPSLRQGARTLIMTPTDAPWLKPDQCFVYSRLPVEAFQGGARWHHYASTWQRIRGIYDGSLEASPEVQVGTHVRLVQPLLDVTLLFLGIPLALGSQRRHVFSSAAKSLVVIAAFTIVVLSCHALGWQGVVRPDLAAWLPVLLLAPLAVLLSEPLHR